MSALLALPINSPADAQVTIGSTMGMAMGGFLGFGVLMMFIAAKNDRTARQRRD